MLLMVRCRWWWSALMSQWARPPAVAMTCSVVNTRSPMVPRMRRSAVLATATCWGSSWPSVSTGRPSACSAAWIAETTGGPIGRSPAAVTFGMNTENKVPAWVTSRHLRPSTQTRWAYQSCSLAWPMAGLDTFSSVSTFAVHRSITSRDRRQRRRRSIRNNAAGTVWRVLIADLGHFLDMPQDAPGPVRRLGQHLGDIVRAGTAGDVGDP